MAIADSLDVCGLPYKVTFEELPETDGNAPLGLCDYLISEIKIHSKQSRESKELTLIHEWMHAVLGTYGIEHREEIISALSLETYRRGFRIKEFT